MYNLLVIFLLGQLLHQDALLLKLSSREKRWLYAFPKGIWILVIISLHLSHTYI